MAPSILTQMKNLTTYERQYIYDTYLETRCREIFLRPYDSNKQHSMYLSIVLRYSKSIEKDIDYYNKYHIRNGLTNFDSFKETHFIDLRLIRLTECCNEYKIHRNRGRYVLVSDYYGYMLHFETEE